ncbi:EmrB/QacA family drug resistance transporter [Alcanivorax hongdengensis A-11-3]|uniref:EmrB/QacA family drug resistance transporter n=1 Tax=Alcanivorax hongdengensis A-11-3 TaxID=1177179 RepID=L0WBN1_9GAMM|nr:DHA2 family efflux MFS transporter permease subunit [Alcanivorax hongdengensis]EKF74379.1 EmrB/QacA family drug resistance transporter [Alcanivorax hongdengensis A-11-3]
MATQQKATNPWLIAPVVAIAAFMEVLDLSIANVALLHIAGSLSATQDEATWVLTSYTVTNAIALPISGWLSNVIGRKRFFMLCIIGFTITSLACGLAPSLGMLIVFRTLQGITGGGLQPSSQAILSDAFPPAKRGMAFALYGIAVVFAPAIGPTLGGWITDHFSWRWVFLINLPVGLILLPLVQALVKDPEHMVEARKARKGQKNRVDYIGFGLLVVGLGALQIVLDRGQQDDWWSSTFILSLAFIAVVGLIAFLVWEWYDKEPIVDVHLFRDRNFAVSNLFMMALGFVLLASTAVLPLYVQELMGYTATQAGLVLTPGGLAIIALMPLVGRLVTKVQTRYLIGFGFLVSGIGVYTMTGFSLQADYNTIMLARLLQASALGFLFIPINTAAYDSLPMEKSSNASAIINLARNIGGSIGISLSTTLLARRTQFHQDRLAENMSPYNPAYQDSVHQIGQATGGGELAANGQLYHQLVEQASMLGYLDVFKCMAILFLCMVPLIFLIRRGISGTGGGAGAH